MTSSVGLILKLVGTGTTIANIF